MFSSIWSSPVPDEAPQRVEEREEENQQSLVHLCVKEVHVVLRDVCCRLEKLEEGLKRLESLPPPPSPSSSPPASPPPELELQAFLAALEDTKRAVTQLAECQLQQLFQASEDRIVAKLRPLIADLQVKVEACLVQQQTAIVVAGRGTEDQRSFDFHVPRYISRPILRSPLSSCLLPVPN